MRFRGSPLRINRRRRRRRRSVIVVTPLRSPRRIRIRCGRPDSSPLSPSAFVLSSLPRACSIARPCSRARPASAFPRRRTSLRSPRRSRQRRQRGQRGRGQRRLHEDDASRAHRRCPPACGPPARRCYTNLALSINSTECTGSDFDSKRRPLCLSLPRKDVATSTAGKLDAPSITHTSTA